MPKKPKENLAIREAELRKTEDLNRREKKALEEKAELVRQRRELDDSESPDTTPAEGAPLFGYADQGFLEVIQNLSTEGSVHVYRSTNAGLKKVTQFPVTDMDALEQQMEKIAYDYGGGLFTLRILSPNGQIAKTKTLSFDEKAYTKPADPSQQSTMLQDRMMQMMVESRRETTELFKTFLMAQAQNKPASPFGNMTVADIIGLLKGNSGPVDFKSMSDLFTRALTMGREMAEGKVPSETGGEDNMLKDLVAPFMAVLQNITSKRPAVPAALPAPMAPASAAPLRAPAPPAVPVSAPAASKEDTIVDPAIQEIKAKFVYKLKVPQILKAAQEGKNPVDVAFDILEFVPETHHGMIRQFAESPDIVDYLAQFEPVARDHAEWVKAVAAAIVAEFEDGEEDGGGEGGDEVPAPETTPPAEAKSSNGHSDAPVPGVRAVPVGA